jgi:hypothetical protein
VSASSVSVDALALQKEAGEIHEGDEQRDFRAVLDHGLLHSLV